MNEAYTFSHADIHTQMIAIGDTQSVAYRPKMSMLLSMNGMKIT